MPIGRFERGEAGTDGNPLIEGRGPGIVHAGNPQAHPRGLLDRMSAGAKRAVGHLFGGVDRNLLCGPVANEECANLAARLLEQTFRNFHVAVSPRSNLEPPWNSQTIDPIPALGYTVVNMAAWTTINSITIPPGKIGIIRRIGQAASTPAAFGDTLWRLVTSNGVPAAGVGNILNPYGTLTGLQHFGYAPPDLAPIPIKLMGPLTLSWQVWVVTPGNFYSVAGRLWGWQYTPLTNFGDNIGSAIAE